MKHKLLSFCLVFLLLVAFPLTVAAQEFDPDQRGSISVSLVSKEGNNALEGAELSVFHIASVKCNDEGKLVYSYTGDFAHCGFALDDPELISKLDAYVTENNPDCRKILTDSQGKAVCEDLSLGLYFVKQSGAVEGFALSAPFLVTVPMETEDGFVYAVDASPKTDVARLIDITIRKVWNTDGAVPGADGVTVQLLQGEIVLDTAVLNAQNNWQITYRDLPESDGYRILEVNVPQGFTATYTQNGYTFTVTNTPTLAQTGQVIWPIPVFAAAGLFFLVLGFGILRKPGKKNA